MNTLPTKKKKKQKQKQKNWVQAVFVKPHKKPKNVVVDTNGLYIFENVAKYKSLMALKILL